MKQQTTFGFTLIEMMVSIGIFSVVIVASIGVLISIRQAEQKAETVQSIQDNFRYTLEFVTKELWQGTNFTGQMTDGSTCPIIGSLKFCDKLSFISSAGQNVWYCFVNGTVLRRAKSDSVDDCVSQGSPLTSSAITISKFGFYMVGDAPGSADGQPRVTIVFAGSATSPSIKTDTTMSLEGTITQRIRDY